MPTALPKLIERTFSSYGNSPVVKAATADGNGNNIASTYATQSSLNATNATVTAHGTAISNIQSAITGRLYNFPEDSATGYIKDVPSGARSSAVLLGWSGKSLAWNQIAPAFTNSNYVAWNQSNITKTFNDGAITATVTSSGSGLRDYSLGLKYSTSISTVIGHKYIVLCQIYPTFSSRFAVEIYGTASHFNNGATLQTGTWNQCGTIQENAERSFTTFLVKPLDYASQGDSYSVKNLVAIDLTQMFGAGNEPTTVAQFRSMFPADYYAYNAGEVVSAQLQSVKSVGVNLFFKADTNRNISSTGTYTQQDGYTMYVAQVIAGESYALSKNGNPVIFGVYGYFNSEPTLGTVTVDGVRHLDGATPITIPEGVTYLAVRFSSSETGIQIEKGSTATSYKPYFSASWSVPSAVKALTGYGWSAGSVSNEVNCETGKYVQRVGRVDLGTLNWTPNWTNAYFSDELNGIVKSVNSYAITTGNFIFSNYEIGSPVNGTAGRANVWYSTNVDRIGVCTGSSSTPTGYLYYELATPVETDISTMLSARVPITVEGGGTIEMKNQLTSMQIPIASREGYAVKLT